MSTLLAGPTKRIILRRLSQVIFGTEFREAHVMEIPSAPAIVSLAFSSRDMREHATGEAARHANSSSRPPSTLVHNHTLAHLRPLHWRTYALLAVPATWAPLAVVGTRSIELHTAVSCRDPERLPLF